MVGICKTCEIKRDTPLIWEGHTEQQILMVNQITPNVAEKQVTSIGNKASTENKHTHQQYLNGLSVTVILPTHDNPGFSILISFPTDS